MTEVEETIVFDALAAIEQHSEVLRALAQRDHSPAAIAAYRDGVYSVGIKLQCLLGPEAIARGKARREKIRKDAEAFFARRKLVEDFFNLGMLAMCEICFRGKWLSHADTKTHKGKDLWTLAFERAEQRGELETFRRFVELEKQK